MRIGSRIYDFSSVRRMGIVNVSPDSFYSGSIALSTDALRRRLMYWLKSGADVVDIGAVSTRPSVQSGYADLASEQEEWHRLEPALGFAREMLYPLPLSVDTFRPGIARRALSDFGVEVINDVSGGSEEMYSVVAEHKAAYVLTYRHGGSDALAEDLLTEVIDFFLPRIDRLHILGVSDVIIDPGFGFNQTVEQSLSLLENLAVLQELGCPILVGISRKRMAYEPAGLTPDTCLEQTRRLEQLAIKNGAGWLRVHE